MKPSPFDHRQDRELGDALRTALSGHGEAAFVQSVVARAALPQDRAREDGDWWEFLSEWARPGLAAAGFAAAMAVVWIATGNSSDSVALLEDPLQASAEIPAAFLAAQPPNLNEVLALELGN